MSNLFQKLELAAFRKGITPRTAESRAWFQKQAGYLGRINNNALLKEPVLKTESDQIPGGMFMYFYDPKTKATLPYYDKFPLTIIVGPAAGGFTGLNLHYLPMVLRAKLLDALMDITSDKKYDDNTKFNLSYNTLKKASKMRYFKPCFKRYLTANVKSRFARVPASEWEIATFLPTASFEKESKTTVWADSRGMI
ncbi:hypothetical protein N8455_00440 [Candidatus Gracilibacteria bacterium]|jgi:hypothetical protein|nr:hypothetical protein [Candidatus Gracilibacteria bacterium]